MNITRRITAALGSSRGLFLIAVLAGSMTGFGFLGLGSAMGDTVTARFADADGLVTGNDVRIAGEIAGSVTSVDFAVDQTTGKQFAQVQFQVDGSHWPLHQGTFVAVKPKGVLSNVFVDLQPGPLGNPSLGDHPFFGLSQTQSPVGLDELNNVFTPSVTEAIRTQLQEGVLALGGSGAPDLNQTLLYADPLTKDTIPVTSVLAGDSPQLSRLNFEFNTISGELAREDFNLRPLITNLDTTLGVLAQRESDVQGILVHAASVFSELNRGLAPVVRPDAGNKIPVAGESDLARLFTIGPQALTCAEAISTYITPIVTQVNPHIPNLDVLLGEFVTATGYNTGTNGGVDALRIDPTTPPHTESAKQSGGIHAEHPNVNNVPAYLAPPNGTLSLPSNLPNGCGPILGTGGIG